MAHCTLISWKTEFMTGERKGSRKPWNKSQMKKLINIRVLMLAQPFTALRPRTATQ